MPTMRIVKDVVPHVPSTVLRGSLVIRCLVVEIDGL